MANYFVYTPKEFKRMQEEGRFFIIDEVIGKGRLLWDRDGTGIRRYPLKAPREKLNAQRGREWIEDAKKDREFAEFLYGKGNYGYSSFFCHQSAEKALKAFL